MKVGIIGEAKRAVAWEQHLRPHRIVKEVDLCPRIEDVGKVDACFLIDDSAENLKTLMKSIRQGLNCFLISKAPTDTAYLEKIFSATKEAGVQVQISNWPVLAPATQWMMNRVNRPSLISINREFNYSEFPHTEEDFKHLWIDEVGLCLKWVNSGINHLEASKVTLENKHSLIFNVFLRFDNGTTADIRIFVGSEKNRHQRIIANKHEALECDVPSQAIRAGRLNSGNLLFFEKQQFDPAKAAEKAASMFLKAVQMGSDTAYSSYDAYQLSKLTERIEQRLSQFS